MDAKILGDYSTIKQIGQGSLGNVYLAEHRFMKKQVVLKVLPEELSADRAFIQRFEEDIAILSSLEHPNIVRIRNISFDQGQYFLVTDCIVDEIGETTNLGQYLLNIGRQLSEDEIYHILKQLAEALDYGHSKKFGPKGIVHRGIKLNNILVGKKNSGSVDVYISDYGLSKIIGVHAVLTRLYRYMSETMGLHLSFAKGILDKYTAIPSDSLKLNSVQLSFLQNFPFLAPEQRKFDPSKPVDFKADIYAFGVLAYYLLTSEFPEGYFEMPSEIYKGYKYHWDFLIQKCLQANPEKRPDLLSKVMEDIQNQKVAPRAVGIEIMNVSKKELAEGQFSLSRASSQEFVQELASSVPPGLQRVVNPEEIQGGGLRPVLRRAQLERPQTDPDPATVFQIDTSVKHYQPEVKEVKNIQPLLTDMVVIVGGAVYRGSNDGNRDETPRHQVMVSNFAMDIHPVTNEQFVRFLEAMGGEKDSNHHDIIRMKESRIKRIGGKLSIESGYAKHPVVGVTWYGSVAYAKWVGKRLPTEAEWEIAACGGEESLYPTGDDIEKNQANFFSFDTTAVMSYAPNNYGLYDMAGNVYEWCQDWYGYNYYEVSVQEPENPKGPLQGVYRVLRGGCWKSLKEDLRCSRRHRNNPGTVNGTYGFRCAADVQPI